jgi:WD40 repeat protein
VGNKNGDLLFMEKNKSVNFDSDSKNITIYKKIRLIHREIKSECTGISLNYDESMLCLSFKNNEISYCNLKNSFDSMKMSNSFELKFNLLCEGYHHSPITSMDVSSQRNILITSSNKDSSIKIWNYINGLSEYCSLIFSEEKQENKKILKNFNILALALHPSGYYLALSNNAMIWFFFIYYKQLKFYGTEQITNSKNDRIFNKRSQCHILKFSNGGKYLVAGNYENNVFVIDSYTREILNDFILKIRGKINDIILILLIALVI